MRHQIKDYGRVSLIVKNVQHICQPYRTMHLHMNVETTLRRRCSWPKQNPCNCLMNRSWNMLHQNDAHEYL